MRIVYADVVYAAIIIEMWHYIYENVSEFVVINASDYFYNQEHVTACSRRPSRPGPNGDIGTISRARRLFWGG
jgi:hypothetical protein